MTDSRDALSNAIEQLCRLIRFDSVSDRSNVAVTDFLDQCLTKLGFETERSSYIDGDGVAKASVIGRRLPSTSPGNGNWPRKGLAFFSHSDVVPVNAWTGPPTDPSNTASHADDRKAENLGPGFQPVVFDKKIYGRGACDMKGPITAMLAAAGLVDADDQVAPLWFVCTADEEVGFEGARQIVTHSAFYREIVAQSPLAIIGEPTELELVHAHKGIVGCKIISHGKAAHSSTDEGVNANDSLVPILMMMRDLSRRCREDASLHNKSFDPPHLSFNYGISDSMSAVNITPARSVAWASLRPMPGIDSESIIAPFEAKSRELGLEFTILTRGKTLWTDPKDEVLRELEQLTNSQARSVSFGTDGGEFDELAHRVVLGPGSIHQAHKPDEWISVDQLAQGIELYEKLIRHYC